MSLKIGDLLTEKKIALQRTNVIALFLTLLAFVIRFIGLNRESFWYDEVYSVRMVRMSAGEIIRFTSGDVHPPLYFLLLHFWTRLFGESQMSVRMLSLCFSVLAVFALYHLAKKLFNERVAFVAALFMTLAPLHLFYSNEARMYSLLTFLAIASAYFFVCLLNDKNRVTLFFYVATTTLLLYTHIYALFVVAGQFLYFVSLFVLARETFQTKLRRWLTAQFITGLLFLPWAFVVLGQVRRARQGFWIKEPDLLMPIETLFEYCGSLWLVLFILPLALWGIIRLSKSANEETETDALPQKKFFLLFWLVFPILTPFLLSKIFSPFYIPKYAIAASVPFYLFAAFGLVQFPDIVWRNVLLILICFCFGAEFISERTKLRRERWADAVYNIEQSGKPGDLVLFSSTASEMSYSYYAKRKDITTAVFPYSALDQQPPSNFTLQERACSEGFVSPPLTEQETKDYLQKIVGDRKRVWIITRFDEKFKNDFIKAFGNEFRLTTTSPLCVNYRRFFVIEHSNDQESNIFLQVSTLSCNPEIFFLER